ncbi:MAG: aminopeptidase N [Simkaniaceae bacterium]|nr:aminopeptidase N [Simkaniaceae bacterium]
MSHQIKYLADYKPPIYFIKEVELTFELEEERTIVESRMKLHRNREVQEDRCFVLNGKKLELLNIAIDGENLPPSRYEVSGDQLRIFDVPDSFVLEIKNAINPRANTSLEGLYMSDGCFCTQNEAEGFRRITYFLDRPDVMAKYTTKIIADKEKYPILLSNGNLIEQGDIDEKKHFTVWQDPFAKPCYLFALVAGDLALVEDTYTTLSKREIALKFYCDHGDEEKCLFAMKSLKEAMRWDEEKFGLEYDLDIYMIVAIASFNAGAMENKGLNIFNSIAVLTDPSSSTDENFIYVQRVIAHEYFHNWTGDRVTLRDWFQLTLKEGLTVFRDEEFSGDMNVKELRRIENVIALKETQFPEDLGPTSHPIQPTSYIEINNFYTRTVYEKGAEVIRMILTLIGWEKFRSGMDRYFELYDGMAVTTEEFIGAMEVASGYDLKQFRYWYHQNGIPEIRVEYTYREEQKEFDLTISQSCHPMVCDVTMNPFYFPLKVALISLDGEGELDVHSNEGRKEGKDIILTIKEPQQTFTFTNVESEPIPSINRGFSAPIITHLPFQKHDYLHLMVKSKDPYNCFESGQEIATQLMLQEIDKYQSEQSLSVDTGYLSVLGQILKDKTIDHALKAKYLALPSESALMQRQSEYLFEANYEVREFFGLEIARAFEFEWNELYHELNKEREFKLDPESMGRRALKNRCLTYLFKLGKGEIVEMTFEQFKKTNNMTDQYRALCLLCQVECAEREQAIELFYDQYKEDALVMMKWFSAQAASPLDMTFDRVKTLMAHPAFDLKVPNLTRALLGAFSENHIRFHSLDQPVYSFYADQMIRLDQLNAYSAARMCGVFKKYPKLAPQHKQMMKTEMERILSTQNLSNNVYEVLSKSLG